MPFKKVGSNDYVSPSGRHFNGAQVRLWHAQGGKFPGQKESEMGYAKGGAPQEAHYAKGGAVLGRTREFLKESDGKLQHFGGPNGKPGQDKFLQTTENNYAKKGAHSIGEVSGKKTIKQNIPRN